MPHEALVILPDAACVAAASDTALRCMGELSVLGSLTRTDAEAAGSIACEGPIVGGKLICGGLLRCLSLGAEGVSTSVWVGAPPRDGREVVEAGWAQHAALTRELAVLSPGPSPRRLELETRRNGILWRLEKLAATFGGGRLEVGNTLHPGVSMRLGLRPERYSFVREIAGPLEISAGENGHPVLRQGDRITPLRGENGWVRV